MSEHPMAGFDPEIEDMPRKQPDDAPAWFDVSKNVRLVIGGLFTSCAILVALDLLYTKHTHFAPEEWFGFYGLYGFVGCVMLVMFAKLLRKVVMRPEDYYDG